MGVVARVPFTGNAPGSDGNTYVLFNSVTASNSSGGGWLAHAGIKKACLALKNSYAGTLKQSYSDNAGVTWVQIENEEIGFTPSTAGIQRDYLIEAFRDWKLEWVNGGAAQTLWSASIALSDDGTFTGIKTGSTSAATNEPVVSGLDQGQNVSLAIANVIVPFASAVALKGVYVSAPLANTAAVYVAFKDTTTTSRGFEMQPGDREFIPVSNANMIFCISGTASQNMRAVAL